MKEQKDIEIDLRSEAMNDMLSDPPSWLIRSGNGLFLLLILLIIGLSWLIEYPDEINGDAIVTTTKPPIEIVNQNYIQLKSLEVRENDAVKAGDLIAQFDIDAKPNDIFRANAYLTKLKELDGQLGIIPEFNSSIELGTFQESWTKLLSQIRDWNEEKKQNIAQKEITSIQREISLREQLQEISYVRIGISEKEYQTIKDELASSERLAESNAISKQTLSQDKKVHSQAQQTIQSQKGELVQNLIELNNLKIKLTHLKHDRWLNDQQMFTNIQVGIASLQIEFRTWKKNTVWIAPCSGKIVFNKILQVNRYYKPNEASIVVVPDASGYCAVGTINSEGAGKVKVGQKSFIELSDYPKNEFGMLEGKVTAITQIDKGGKYEVKIKLPKQLKTTYDKQIPFKSQFSGKVKVITKSKRLLTRFFDQLINLLK